MVKRVSLTLFFILLIVVVLINNHADGDSYREIVIGSPPKDAGEWIAKGGGYKLIEFWHSSSGYWKATMNTESGKKVLVINDDETDKDAWTKPEFMKNRIYASKFILEYKINHPKEVTDALKNGATITPILNICKETIYCSDNKELTIDKFFNFEPLPDGNKAGLPEKPELIVGEECILIRALPQLSCQIETFNEKVTFYPHKIPIVDTSCGSLSYAMYHHEGEHTGIGYSPDPSYEGQGIKTIKYKNINDLRGWLKPGFQVTTDIDPNRTDELSDNLKIGHETFADAGAISIRFWYPIRQEVDLWYHEDFNGKMNYYIKIESTGRNRENPKNMVLDDIYRNVPEKEITDTIRILGFNRDSFEKGSRPVGWLDQIILSQYQRTFTGLKTWLPAGVDADTAIKSVQKWYGEYYLPNDLFASAKGYDVTEYGRTHNGLNGKESFWLKDGFIIVNFQIESVQNNDFNNPILSYGGSSWCNMFQREGFAYVKTDNNSIAFNLQDGDIVFYDTDRRSSDDYQIGGTH